MGKGITAKHKRFCQEYIIDLNAGRAAIRAGYSKKTADQTASRLLRNVKIQAYLAELQKTVSEKLNLTAEWVISRFKEISDRCMTAVPVMEFDHDAKEMKPTGEYEFDSSGANKATEMIGKHLGVFEKDNQQKQTKFKVTVGKK